MIMLQFLDSYVQTFVVDERKNHTMINGVKGACCSAIGVTGELPLCDQSLSYPRSSKTRIGSDKSAKGQNLTLNGTTS